MTQSLTVAVCSEGGSNSSVTGLQGTAGSVRGSGGRLLCELSDLGVNRRFSKLIERKKRVASV